MLQAIASLASVACGKAEAFEAARAAARTDSLTGLLNHGAVQVRTAEEIWRARRGGAGLTCLLADLDNFKPINDRHGHLVGDEILQAGGDRAWTPSSGPTTAWPATAATSSWCCCPTPTRTAACVAARRLRTCVARTGLAFGDLGLPVTASVGIAQWARAADRGRAARPRRPGAAAGQAPGQGLARGGQRPRRAGAGRARDGQRAIRAHELLLETWWPAASQPSEVLDVLPSFVRRELELEEVAFYERADMTGPAPAWPWIRAPGDPAPCGVPPAARGSLRGGVAAPARRLDRPQLAGRAPARARDRGRRPDPTTIPGVLRGGGRGTRRQSSAGCCSCATRAPSSRAPACASPRWWWARR